jgi:hypothetical protein
LQQKQVVILSGAKDLFLILECGTLRHYEPKYKARSLPSFLRMLKSAVLYQGTASRICRNYGAQWFRKGMASAMPQVALSK